MMRLTQPAISAQIKRLQQLVGGEVFLRSGFGISLSEKGEIVSRYAQGDLSVDMDRLPGKKAQITQAMDSVKSQLTAINGEIQRLVISRAVTGLAIR